MMKDARSGRLNRYPYDILKVAGITPLSTMKEIKDASFDLMAQGLMDLEVRAAWDELRDPRMRMLVDIGMHRLNYMQVADELAHGSVERRDEFKGSMASDLEELPAASDWIASFDK